MKTTNLDVCKWNIFVCLIPREHSQDEEKYRSGWRIVGLEHDRPRSQRLEKYFASAMWPSLISVTSSIHFRHLGSGVEFPGLAQVSYNFISDLAALRRCHSHHLAISSPAPTVDGHSRRAQSIRLLLNGGNPSTTLHPPTPFEY